MDHKIFICPSNLRTKQDPHLSFPPSAICLQAEDKHLTSSPTERIKFNKYYFTKIKLNFMLLRY